MNLPEFSIRRKVTILMVTCGIVVFGLFSLNRLELKLLPDVSYPTLTVQTEYSGATPEDVEKLISQPIEESLGTINNLKEITSISKAGSSEVIAEFNWGASMDKALMDIREKLDLLRLPEHAGKPRILRYNPESEPIMTLALTGPDLVRLQNLADLEIKPKLETLDGVAAADVLGGDKEEIRISISLQKLDTYDLSLDDITQRVQKENINMPGGILEDGKTEYLVRIVNEYQSLSDIGDIIVKSDGKTDVRLRDVATIQRVPVKRKTITYFNNQPSVLIDIYKEGDANILKTADRVRKMTVPEKGATARFRKSSNIRDLLPGDTALLIVSDQSRFIRAAVDEVRKTAVYGCFLAVFVLFFFLRNLQHTMIVSIAIPISVISTFTLMYFKDLTLNLMSLGGLALGIGMLVDNSIVVLENIFRFRESGESAESAALKGASTVATAVTASTLTTIAVFFPIVFVTGFAGQIFGDLAWTIAFSLLASLIVSLSLIPMISSLKTSLGYTSDRTIPIVKFFRNVHEAVSRESDNNDSGFRRWPVYFLIFVKAFFRGIKIHLSVLLAYITGRTSTGETERIVKRFLLFPFRLAYYLLLEILILIKGLIINLVFLCLFPMIFLVTGGWFLFNRMITPFLNLFNRALEFSRRRYVLLIEKSLSNPMKIILISILVFIVIGYLTIPGLGMNLIPSFSQGNFYVDIKLPPGSGLENTEIVVKRILNSFRKLDEIEHISSVIGINKAQNVNLEIQEANAASLEILLKEPYRTKQEELIVKEKILRILSRIPGISEWKIRHPTLFSLKTPLEIEIQGTDLTAMAVSARLLTEQLKTIPGLTGVYSTLSSGYPEIQIRFDPVKLARLNLSPSDVSSALKTVISGTVPTDFGDPGHEIDIRVQADRSDQWTLDRLENLVINPESDPPVTLKSVAEIEAGIGPNEIRRINHRRVIVIKSDVIFWDLKRITTAVKALLMRLPPEPGVSYFVSGQSAEMKSSMKNLQTALLMAVFLVYLVMASQFESLIQPMIILLSIPFAFIGVLLVLKLFAIPLSVMVFIGMIVLAGIIVNNAIVLIDTINDQRNRGSALTEAVIKASETRFRPILMTVSTTILGLVPMIIEQGAGVELRMPLALTIIAGLLSGTFLTLVIIPTIYFRISRKKP